ncbi:hypothetical protein GCM10010389_31400 [Streptomyces echinoruber]|uniref:Uncharacterized protein n=1 Tax=Streptomyces echinoruber TaxID=68898 RepID=A0A918VEG1_9ACTN|nr:hypothetical protein GCM10010389_31400 [Streptomyces echinoruber]
MVAVAGHHLGLCGVQGCFVTEVGVRVVDLQHATAGGGGDVVFGEKRRRRSVLPADELVHGR